MKLWNRLSISKKLLASVLIITSMASLMMIGFFLYRMRGNLENEIEQKLLVMTEGYAQTFSQNIKDVEHITVSLEGEFLKRIEGEALTSDVLDQILYNMSDLVEMLAQNSNQGNTAYIYIDPEITGDVHDVYFADQDGDGLVERQDEINRAYYNEKGAINEIDASKAWWFGPKLLGRDFWTSVYTWSFDNGESTEFVSYTKPLYVQDRFVGIVGSDLLFSNIVETLKTVNDSGRGMAYLIDNKENILLQGGQETMPISSVIGGLENYQFDGQLGEDVQLIEYTIEGEDMLSAAIRLENGWIFGIAIYEEVMFRAFNNTVNIIIFALGLIAAFAGFGFYRVGQSLTKPIIELVDLVDEIDTINYQKIELLELEYRDDEIGQLQRAIDEMVSKIREGIFYIQHQNDELKIQMRRNEQMKEKMEIAFDALSNANDGILIIDSDFNVVYYNQSLMDQFLIDKEHLQSEIRSLIPDYLVTGDLSQSKQWKIQRRFDGQVRNFMGTFYSIGASGEVFLINFRDVTSDIHQKNQLEALQVRDLLTGLFNRLGFQNEVSNYLEAQSAYQGVYALMLINIDQFRSINDSIGFQRANKFLIKVGEAIGQIFGDACIVSRTNGDEFGVFIKEDLNGLNVENKVESLCNQIENAYEVDGEKIYFNYSIGVSLIGVDSNSCSESMDNAHSALNQAKAIQGSRLEFFNREVLQLTIENYQMVKGLREAIDNKSFEVYYQPKWSVDEKKCVGLEALARWNWNGEFIPPDMFIRVAEFNNMMLEVGEVIMSKSAQFMKRLSDENLSIPISVNVSAVQFSKGYFESYIESIIKTYDIDPSLLEIELTESVLINNQKDAREIIEFLRDLGIQTSIDDFGKGYSSLSYLKNFNVHTLKIDRDFVKDIPVADDGSLANLIVNLGRSLSVDVVAEGVEEKEQLEFLKSIGCHIIQGFYISKPMPEDDVINWLKEQKNLSE